MADLEDGEEGVDGRDEADEGVDGRDEGVEGLRLSADWALLGSCVVGAAEDVRAALGDVHLLGVLGVETGGVEEIPDLYLEAISRGRGFRLGGAALFFSEGTNGGLVVVSSTSDDF